MLEIDLNYFNVIDFKLLEYKCFSFKYLSNIFVSSRVQVEYFANEKTIKERLQLYFFKNQKSSNFSLKIQLKEN